MMIIMCSTTPQCQYFPLSNSLPPDTRKTIDNFFPQPRRLPQSNAFWKLFCFDQYVVELHFLHYLKILAFC